MRSRRLWTIGAFFVPFIFPPGNIAQTVVTTITRPGMYPTAVAVYETGNKFFIADQTAQRVYRYDGSTNAELDSVVAGTLVYRMAVDEPRGKLYALSMNSGVITVINAATGALIGTHTGYLDSSADIQLDSAAGKLYAISHGTGLRQIDVQTEAETDVPGLDLSGFCALAVNPVTHEVFVSSMDSSLLNIVNGSTLAVSQAAFPAGYGLGVNWLDDKVYSAWPGNSIYDRATGQVIPIGVGSNQNDAERLTFNPVSGRMYTNAEVDSYTTIVDGDTAATWNLPLDGTASAPVVLVGTNHVYFAGIDRTIALEDSSQLSKVIPVANSPQGGLLIQAIAANQTTGRVYTINDQSLGWVGVIQDAPSSCTSSIAPGTGHFAMFATPLTVTVTASSGCSWAVAEPTPSSVTPGSFLFSPAHPAVQTGSGSVSVTAWDNAGSAARTGTLLIAGKLYTGTQDGNSCSYSIDPSSQSFGGAGGSGSFDVTAGSPMCGWSNTIDSNWISTLFATGAGSMTIPYTVAANPNASSRTGTITLEGFGGLTELTLTVTQAGCASVSPSAVYFDSNSQSSSITVTASSAGCAWTASTGAGFITITSGASGVGSGVVVFQVPVNSTGAARSGALSIGGQSVAVTQRESAQTFADVNPQDYYFDFINVMYARGITGGCGTSPLRYCPGNTVTRGQMAVFIVTSIYGGSSFTYSGTPYFTDVPSTHLFFRWIQKLKELGITGGCTATQFCPDNPVTRGQMAVFIMRTRYETVPYSYPTTPYFTDVPSSHLFFSFIQKMKQAGVTSGCAANLFCPDQALPRGQMAIFIVTGLLNELWGPSVPVVTAAGPNQGTRGQTVTVTLTGAATHFAQGVTQVIAAPGITPANISVLSETSLTVELLIAPGAAPGPTSLVVLTGSEEAVLPNGFTVQ